MEYPNAFYHVMNRGLNKCPIFIDEYDRRLLQRTIGEAVSQWNIKIHAFSLMANHYHLLVETPLANISRAMRHIDGIYTQRFNRVHRRDGPLFRGRFKSILIQKETYFLELIRYIHLNGVKAHVAQSPELDLYSSHYDYLHPEKAAPWLVQSMTLSYFISSPNPRDELHRFVLRGIPDSLDKILSNKIWPPILGEKSFILGIKDEHLTNQQKNPELPQKNHLLKIRKLKPEEVISSIFEVYNSKRGLTSEANLVRETRWVKIFFLRRYSSMTFATIGNLLGGLSYKSVQGFFNRYDFSNSPSFSIVKKNINEKWKGAENPPAKKMSHVAT